MENTNKTAWRDVALVLHKKVQEPVYTFEELEADVQNALIQERMESEEEYHRDFGYDVDAVFDMFHEDLKEECGFDLTDWKYDISYCQGCGAAIIGEFLTNDDAVKTAEKYANFTEEEKAILREWLYGVKIKDGRGNYCHKYTVDVDFDFEIWDDADEYEGREEFLGKLEEKFENALEKWKNDVSDDLFKTLELEMEYQDSEEAARDYLDGWGAYFYADGEEVDEEVA